MNVLTALKPKPKSAKKQFSTAVAKAVVSTGMVVLGVLYANSHSYATLNTDNPNPYGTSNDEQVMSIRPSAPKAPKTVFKKHADVCWTSSQTPKTKELPGHVIVQKKNGAAVYTADHETVSLAFNEALASIGYGEHADPKTLPFIRVVALCV